MHGKRTVCTPEAARGVAAPPEGLWIATRPQFPTAVAAALAYPWSATSARSLRDWMDEHHGLGRLRSAWAETLRATSESTSQISDHAMRHSVDDETSGRSWPCIAGKGEPCLVQKARLSTALNPPRR